jgi:hypothetical protein
MAPRNDHAPGSNRGGSDAQHGHGGITKNVTVLVPVQARRNGTCWRCGAEFESTDLSVLAHCYALARAAS